jgi:hypothetical protein
MRARTCAGSFGRRALNERPIFRLRLQALPSVDPIRALRAALKRLLRIYGLKCISCGEEKHDEADSP